jgi:DNA-directed RNA polymerase specialized sigma24 family protein
MATPHKKNPQWWDHELDRSGRPIREDVRAAAHEVWEQVCNRARALLGDDTDAAEMLEVSVEAVSRYLNRKKTPLFSTKISGLLDRAFHFQAKKRRYKTERIETVGTTNELAELEPIPDWSAKVDRELDLRKILQHLSPRSCSILWLRQDGHDWQYIANKLGIALSTAQNVFWREIKQARLKLQLAPDSEKTDRGD